MKSLNQWTEAELASFLTRAETACGPEFEQACITLAQLMTIRGERAGLRGLKLCCLGEGLAPLADAARKLGMIPADVPGADVIVAEELSSKQLTQARADCILLSAEPRSRDVAAAAAALLGEKKPGGRIICFNKTTDLCY